MGKPVTRICQWSPVRCLRGSREISARIVRLRRLEDQVDRRAMAAHEDEIDTMADSVPLSCPAPSGSARPRLVRYEGLTGVAFMTALAILVAQVRCMHNRVCARPHSPVRASSPRGQQNGLPRGRSAYRPTDILSAGVRRRTKCSCTLPAVASAALRHRLSGFAIFPLSKNGVDAIIEV